MLKGKIVGVNQSLNNKIRLLNESDCALNRFIIIWKRRNKTKCLGTIQKPRGSREGEGGSSQKPQKSTQGGEGVKQKTTRLFPMSQR